jgi:hypothetical protein
MLRRTGPQIDAAQTTKVSIIALVPQTYILLTAGPPCLLVHRFTQEPTGRLQDLENESSGSVDLFQRFGLQLRPSAQDQGDRTGGVEGSATSAVSEQRPSSTRPDDNDLPAVASSSSYLSIANPYTTQPESIQKRMLHLPEHPEHDEAGLGELVAGVGGTARTARSLLLPDRDGDGDGDGVYPHSRNLSRVAGNRYSMMERDKDIVELGLVTLEFAQILFDK